MGTTNPGTVNVVTTPWSANWLTHATDAAALTDLGFSAYMAPTINDADLATFLATLGCGAPFRSIADDADNKAVAATLQLAYMKSVLWFGAVGNGVANDTAAIQATIDAVEADGGGTVFFPPGSYLIDAALVADGDVSFFGTPGSKIMEAAGSTVAAPMLRIVNGDHISVRGMTIQGALVHLGWVGSTDYTYAGLKLDTCTNVIVEGCTVTDRSQGVWAINSTDLKIIGNHFSGMFDPADYGDGAEYNYASAVRIGLDGICYDVVVANNWIYHWASGCTVSEASERVLCEHNTIRDMCENGIYVSSGLACSAVGNVISGPIGYGVKMRGSYMRAIGNHIVNAGRAVQAAGGINLTAVGGAGFTSYNGVIQGNTIDTTTSHGIVVDRNACDGYIGIVIEGNTLRECGDSAIADNYGLGIFVSAGCKNVTVRGNVVRGGTTGVNKGVIAAMGSAGLECDGIVVQGNILDDINSTGIVLNYIRDFTVSGNVLREYANHGVYFAQADVNLRGVISGNVFSNQTAAGATGVHGAAANCVLDAILSDNHGFGAVTNTVSANCRNERNRVIDCEPPGTPDVAKTADDAIAATDSGSVFSNRGAAAQVTLSLPAATVGLTFEFVKQAAQNFYIDPNGGEVIRGGGGGKYLIVTNAGDWFELLCVTAGTWEVGVKHGVAAFEP